MSEFINNSETRQIKLKALIKKIHDGLDLEAAKVLFKKDFDEITTDEIVALEQGLINEGMPISEVQRLCDVHAALFDGSISDIHKRKELVDIAGHPANIFKSENDEILKLINNEIEIYLNKHDNTSILMLRIGFERLMEVSKHYARKENLFFPGLEKKGITSIPKVMWGVDNEIREMLKNVITQLNSPNPDNEKLDQDIKLTLEKIKDMVTKENNILLPKLAEVLSFSNWITIDMATEEIGYFLEKPKVSWKLEKKADEAPKEDKTSLKSDVIFDAGGLNQNELNAMLNTLPFDMTFVDKDGFVKYFTQGKERIFNRPLTVIGRHVTMCHPPQSVHIVEEIVDSFKSGEKDHEDFYINMGPMFVYISYYAVRDKSKNYLGTLEVTQNIKPFRELTGEKRLVSK